MKIIDNFEGEYRFLSNFADSPIAYARSEGILKFPTVEHFFQAMKTKTFKEQLAFTKAKTPGEAKRLGRHVQLREDWEDIKDDIMLTALQIKFGDPVMREKLLATEDAELIEGNWWHDNYWGSCHCKKCQNHGKNKLGKLLMQVREEERNKK